MKMVSCEKKFVQLKVAEASWSAADGFLRDDCAISVLLRTERQPCNNYARAVQIFHHTTISATCPLKIIVQPTNDARSGIVQWQLRYAHEFMIFPKLYSMHKCGSFEYVQKSQGRTLPYESPAERMIQSMGLLDTLWSYAAAQNDRFETARQLCCSDWFSVH